MAEAEQPSIQNLTYRVEQAPVLELGQLSDLFTELNMYSAKASSERAREDAARLISDIVFEFDMRASEPAMKQDLSIDLDALMRGVAPHME